MDGIAGTSLLTAFQEGSDFGSLPWQEEQMDVIWHEYPRPQIDRVGLPCRLQRREEPQA
jgi:hypothetical protein